MGRLVDPRRRLVDEVRAHTARTWPFPVVRGVLAIALAGVALLAPLGTVEAELRVLGVFVVVDSALLLVRAARSWGWPGSGLLAGQGGVSAVFGAVLAVQGGMSARTLLTLTALGALAAGCATVVLRTQQRWLAPDTWRWDVTAGGLVALFGLLLAMVPGAAVGTVAVLVGVFATAVGLAKLAVGFRLRAARHRPSAASSDAGSSA